MVWTWLHDVLNSDCIAGTSVYQAEHLDFCSCVTLSGAGLSCICTLETGHGLDLICSL